MSTITMKEGAQISCNDRVAGRPRGLIHHRREPDDYGRVRLIAGTVTL